MSSLYADLAADRLARPIGHRSHRVNAPPMAKAEEKIGTRPRKGGGDPHAGIHQHLQNAIAANDPTEKRGHVFRALSAINALGRTKRAAPEPDADEMGGPSDQDADEMGGGAPPHPHAGLMQALHGLQSHRAATMGGLSGGLR